MAYSLDEVVKELTKFYEFLVSMYFPADALKYSPEGGWPGITPERLAFMNKDEEVITLLKHIPYIRREDSLTPYYIYEHRVCSDYSGKFFEDFAVRYQSKRRFDPPEMDKEPHVATLAVADPSHSGHYMYFDTKTGTLRLDDFPVGSGYEYSIDSFLEVPMDQYRELSAVPLEPMEVQFDRSEQVQTAQLLDIYRKHSWPISEYRKDDCLAAVKASVDAFFKS